MVFVSDRPDGGAATVPEEGTDEVVEHVVLTPQTPHIVAITVGAGGGAIFYEVGDGLDFSSIGERGVQKGAFFIDVKPTEREEIGCNH